MRALRWVLGGAVLLIIGGELVARFYLGLGTPPLYQTHPTIEYLYRPNQSVHRFGNLFKTNRYGMRSDDFPPRLSSPDELRIMVYGDSVVNGGTLTDHSHLATTYVQETLHKELRRPVMVGNISAGSWGPPNELAYLQQYGFLDAAVVVLVLSSDDFEDAPTFEPLNPLTHPTETPISALWEGITRYLPRYLHGHPAANEIGAEVGAVPDPLGVTNERDIEVSLAAERQFVEMAKAKGVKVIIVQHWMASELRSGKTYEGHKDIHEVAVEAGAPTYDDSAELQSYLSRGQNPYRDDIHLNDNGQRALADLLLVVLKRDFADVVRPAAVAEKGR